MPFKSVAELGDQFHGLPERGKRVAVHIMNALEEQGLIGQGATERALQILGMIYTRGADGQWQQPIKMASVKDNVLLAALLMGAGTTGKETLMDNKKNYRISIGHNAPVPNSIKLASNYNMEKIAFGLMIDTLYKAMLDDGTFNFVEHNGVKTASTVKASYKDVLDKLPGLTEFIVNVKVANKLAAAEGVLAKMFGRAEKPAEDVAKGFGSKIKDSVKAVGSEIKEHPYKSLAIATALAGAGYGAYKGYGAAKELGAPLVQGAGDIVSDWGSKLTAEPNHMLDGAEAKILAEALSSGGAIPTGLAGKLSGNSNALADLLSAGTDAAEVIKGKRDVFGQIGNALKTVGGVGAGVAGSLWGAMKAAPLLHKYLTRTETGKAGLEAAGNILPDSAKSLGGGVDKILRGLDEPISEPFLERMYHAFKANSPTIVTETVSRTLPYVAFGLSAFGANKIYNNYQANRTFNKIMDTYPELNDEDKERASRYFSLIENYAPTVAKDPIGAGGLLKGMLALPDALDTNVIKNLIDLEKGTSSFGGETIKSLATGMGRAFNPIAFGGNQATMHNDDWTPPHLGGRH